MGRAYETLRDGYREYEHAEMLDVTMERDQQAGITVVVFTDNENGLKQLRIESSELLVQMLEFAGFNVQPRIK